ncbi:hypothetical protein BT93_B0017 [Corymbia citriodora subsp. variegata]|nr:hypothetical protein BT93_B0017 [Corymbia citriodora subsp. variegata]
MDSSVDIGLIGDIELIRLVVGFIFMIILNLGISGGSFPYTLYFGWIPYVLYISTSNLWRPLYAASRVPLLLSPMTHLCHVLLSIYWEYGPLIRHGLSTVDAETDSPVH